MLSFIKQLNREPSVVSTVFQLGFIREDNDRQGHPHHVSSFKDLRQYFFQLSLSDFGIGVHYFFVG